MGGLLLVLRLGQRLLRFRQLLPGFGQLRVRVGVAVQLGLGFLDLLLGFVYCGLSLVHVRLGGLHLLVRLIELVLGFLGCGLLLLVHGLLRVGLVLRLSVGAVGGLTGLDCGIVCVEGLLVGFVLSLGGLGRFIGGLLCGLRAFL